MILTFDVKMYWLTIKINYRCFGKYQPVFPIVPKSHIVRDPLVCNE